MKTLKGIFPNLITKAKYLDKGTIKQLLNPIPRNSLIGYDGDEADMVIIPCNEVKDIKLEMDGYTIITLDGTEYYLESVSYIN